MKIYLSIDLDYWCKDKTPRRVNAFFKKVFALREEIMVVESHERLLSHINHCKGCDVLCNVDFHSDFVGNYHFKKEDGTKDKPMDANWVNFVSWRKKGHYIWVCPFKQCYRNLFRLKPEGDGACWGAKEDNPFEEGWHDWKEASYFVDTNMFVNTNLLNVVAVGISLSQDYLLGNHEIVRKVVSDLGVTDRFYDTLSNRHCFNSRWRKIVDTAS